VNQPHLCHFFPAFTVGGPQVRTAAVIRELGRAFRHTVVSLNGDLSCAERLDDAAEVRLIAAPPDGWGRLRPLALARLLRSLRPDLVLTYNWGGTDGVLAARLCGIRRVIHAEDGFGPDEARGQKFRRLLARRLLLARATRVICPSHALVRTASGAWRLPADQVCYLPNGVDAARYAPAAPGEAEATRRRLGWTSSEVVVGTVGQLRAEKNYNRLLRTWAAVAPGRDTRLVFVGDGSMREALAARARELGVAGRVHFAGAVADPVEYYRAMDVFALSSDTEQMPIAVLEAMSAGLPVVSTEVGDVRTMVAAENQAHVVPVGREDAYSASLAALLDDAGTRAALGAANRERCLREYDVGAMVRAYHRLYREVLETGR
jgi:glycosyltransferase involved in cell wall biosynthesis